MFRINRACFLRTGFLRTDPPMGGVGPYHFIDPDGPLFATSNEFRYTDDPTMRAPVLERSNVGMGLLLSNSDRQNFPLVNSMYSRLRNLEVNTLKRFTVLTMSDKHLPIGGIGNRQLLLLNYCMQQSKSRETASHFMTHLLINQADLAFLVADYFKPLITLLDGSDSGVALASLANYSSSYRKSVFSLNLMRHGFVPTGGLSFALARTPWNIGEFLLLTNRKLSGANLLFSGLTKRWMSPEAVPHMEVTSEHKLEMSEKDGTSLLSEHFLKPPIEEFSLKAFVPLINDVFGADSVSDIHRNLTRIVESGGDSKQIGFAKECIDQMNANCPLAMALGLALVREARSAIALASDKIEKDFGFETLAHIQSKPRLTQSEINKPALIQSLGTEVSVALQLLARPEFGHRLHALMTGAPMTDLTTTSATDIASAMMTAQTPYMYRERSDFPLSAHPKLRRHHPDYNAETGMDHDPVYMQNEVKRWSLDFQKSSLEQLQSTASGLSIDEIKKRTDIRWDD